MRLTTVLNATIAGAFISFANPGFATTLTDALIQAYQTNPALRVGRSSLRATDETVRQATGALEPTISANLSADRSGTRRPRTETPSNSGTLTVQIPIYAGGTGLKGIEQARYNVLASRQALKLTEQSVLLDAVTAFMDVRRDQRNVQLAINSVKVLNEEVRAARERFEVGEVTRTDVSQAESRQAASESTLQATRAALARSIDFYIATVGSKPVNLRTPPPAPKLPSSGDAAESIAIAKHPNILQQQFLVSAAEKAVEIAFGNKLPVASATLSARRGTNTTLNSVQNSGTIGLDINQVIYQGGRLNSAERQAAALLDQEKAELQLTGVQVRQNVQSQYATWFASKASIQARQKQVRAAQIAFDGTTEEAKLGARTTLDALDAEQELLQARFDLVSAIRDEYVNAYGVLSTMGILSVDHLRLGVKNYDPDTHYNAVNGPQKFGAKRSKIFDKIKKLSGN
jgi:outer membrane protein